MQGRRLPDTPEGSFPLPYDELKDGDCWKVLDRETGEPLVVTEYPSNLTGAAWTVIAPGHLFANLRAHTVREHADGTISVRPASPRDMARLHRARRLERLLT